MYCKCILPINFILYMHKNFKYLNIIIQFFYRSLPSVLCHFIHIATCVYCYLQWFFINWTECLIIHLMMPLQQSSCGSACTDLCAGK